MEKIPKIVHCCWFGKTEIPNREQSFIDEWSEFFPDYEIKIWNEENFDIDGCVFCRQAYDKKQYAFVSDYVRAKVLYEYGGIYLDTDVKIIKSMPMLNGNLGIMGFERKKFLGTAVIATPSRNSVIKKLLDYYEEHTFIQEDGTVDIIANVSILTDIMVEQGLILGGEEQECAGFHVFPREVFYPKKLGETEFMVDNRTCAIHYCNNSWMTEREKQRGNSKVWINVFRPVLQKMRKVLVSVAGADRVRKLEIKFRNKLR